MFRRDFLKAIAAVGAATVAPTIARPRGGAGGVAIGQTLGGDINAQLRALLKRSKCISISRDVTRYGVVEYRTAHRALDDSIGGNLDAEFESWLAGAKPSSITCTQEAGYIDVSHLGQYRSLSTVPRAVNVIEVEWIGGIA